MRIAILIISTGKYNRLGGSLVTEQWWRDGDVKEYIAGGTDHFWGIIDDLCSNSML